MVVYMMDYLPQILPHDESTNEDTGILAAPISYDPMILCLRLQSRWIGLFKHHCWCGGVAGAQSA